MAINTDSSQMLYPDFTHNMQSLQMTHLDNPNYYDIAEYKNSSKQIGHNGKKRTKKDAYGKNQK